MTMMRSASLRIDEEVDATIEDGKIIIEKSPPRKKYSLKDLLSKANEKNSHEFVDSSVGNEIW